MTLRVPSADPCPFCAYLAGDAECAFVTRTESVASFVNLRQYERGALLVIPVRHLPTVLDVDADMLGAVHWEAVRLGRALIRAFDASGLNIFQNNGISAGQTVPHYHVHVVPRYARSDPRRRFQEGSFEAVAFSERLEIAESIRTALGAI